MSHVLSPASVPVILNIRDVPYLLNVIYSSETTCVRWTGWTGRTFAHGDRVPVTSCVFKVLIPMVAVYLLAVVRLYWVMDYFGTPLTDLALEASESDFIW